jgi:hypothetical protein
MYLIVSGRFGCLTRLGRFGLEWAHPRSGDPPLIFRTQVDAQRFLVECRVDLIVPHDAAVSSYPMRRYHPVVTAPLPVFSKDSLSEETVAERRERGSGKTH